MAEELKKALKTIEGIEMKPIPKGIDINLILESMKAVSGIRLSDPNQVASAYLDLKRIEKLCKELLDGMKEEVRSYLDDGEMLERGNQYLMKQEESGRQTCDWKGLIEKHPGSEKLVMQFVKQSPPIVKIVVKTREQELPSDAEAEKLVLNDKSAKTGGVK